MLEITRQADYALLAVLEIATLAEGERMVTSAISENQDIPLPFLTKIISRLVAGGILETARGSGGGVRLARQPEEITMYDVIQAIDGPITLNRCMRVGDGCGRAPDCPMCSVFDRARQKLIAELDDTSVADLQTIN